MHMNEQTRLYEEPRIAALLLAVMAVEARR